MQDNSVIPAQADVSEGAVRVPASLPLAFSVVALVTALACATYLYRSHRNAVPTERFGVVDLNSIVNAKEKAFTIELSKPGITDADRGKAYEQIKALGASLEAGVASVREQCQCILLVRGAVLASDPNSLPDYTAQLKAAVEK
jgi:hypothetical protein